MRIMVLDKYGFKPALAEPVMDLRSSGVNWVIRHGRCETGDEPVEIHVDSKLLIGYDTSAPAVLASHAHYNVEIDPRPNKYGHPKIRLAPGPDKSPADMLVLWEVGDGQKQQVEYAWAGPVELLALGRTALTRGRSIKYPVLIVHNACVLYSRILNDAGNVNPFGMWTIERDIAFHDMSIRQEEYGQRTSGLVKYK